MVNAQINIRDNSVSPVVGVMLMIVVVLIIAAVVSLFATDMLSSPKTSPTAQIGYGVIID